MNLSELHQTSGRDVVINAFSTQQSRCLERMAFEQKYQLDHEDDDYDQLQQERAAVIKLIDHEPV
jgi:hypothetical protein